MRDFMGRLGKSFGILTIVLALTIAGSQSGHAELLAADIAHDQVTKGELLLIDVRSPQEWRQTGIPQNAETITIHNSRGLAGFIEEVIDAVGGDRSRPIAVICASGVRSRAAERILAQQGFTNVHDVGEGVLGNGELPGWRNRGLPMEACPDC